MSPDATRVLRDRRDELKTALAELGDLRPGSLVERYRRCGKPNCRCAAEGVAGHGPSWSLTREVNGKTVTTVIPAQAVERTRDQIAEYKRFRRLSKELVDASEQLCEARLSEPEVASKEVAQKGGSNRPSKPRSSPKSKR
jgi:hypothetical protein